MNAADRLDVIKHSLLLENVVVGSSVSGDTIFRVHSTEYFVVRDTLHMQVCTTEGYVEPQEGYTNNLEQMTQCLGNVVPPAIIMPSRNCITRRSAVPNLQVNALCV
jgi:hypothetical protein